MDKKEVIERLSGMNCEIAEVIGDINKGLELAFPDESVLVILVSNPSIKGLINSCKHWTTCDSIDDFNEGIVCGKDEARETRCKHYFNGFKEVREFKGDY